MAVFLKKQNKKEKKKPHCYIRAQQVETEIPLSAVEGWLAISPGFKGE